MEAWISNRNFAVTGRYCRDVNVNNLRTLQSHSMHQCLVFHSAITNVPLFITDSANNDSDSKANVHLIKTIVSHREVSSKSRNCVPHNLT